MSIKFQGINTHAKDPVKTFEFYKGIGLTVSEEAAPDDEWYGASFDIGNGSLLWVWREHEGANGGQKSPIQIVFHSTDMDADYIALKEKGYDITEPELMFYGGREMKLTDPDGNSILFLD